ncbi:hypothetical protein DVH24_038688 [Malus domestica]|uniref:Transcription factor n=1 Tax=Malus domestica TaxID=3750 RepID=A0A498KDH1_MALDO|nr:hypothetical protein DVH24_038688 [Malus domestica]
MEELTSFCCSPTSSPTFQRRVQFIVQNRPECWLYAIFWQASKDSISDQVALSWAGGHLNNPRVRVPSNRSNRVITNNYQPKLGFSNMEKKKTAIISKRDEDVVDLDMRLLADNHDGTGDATHDSDRFYFYGVSLTQSFAAGQASKNILGRAFCSGGFVWLAGGHELQLYECERVKEARMHGIQTLVCITTSCGVLELASLDVIMQDWGLVHLSKSLFGSDQKNNKFKLLVPDPLEKIGFLSGGQKEFTIQEGGANEPIIHTDGSSTGSSYDSFGNFTPANTENPQSKKRGRSSSSNHGATSRESQLLNHVEAEKQRRDKLNHRICLLRSIVPNVSEMDRSSLLADAVAYMNQLKGKVDELEAKIQAQPPQKPLLTSQSTRSITDEHHQCSSCSNNYSNNNNHNNYNDNLNLNNNNDKVRGTNVLEVDVKIVGSNQAMIRVQCPDQDYPYARLMNALKGLELQVYHASISSVKKSMIQDVVVGLPYGFTSEEALRLGIIKRWYN